MRAITTLVPVTLSWLLTVQPVFVQKPRSVVAVFAHPDDEGSVAPILARYARQGDAVHLVIATDGAQGAAHTSIPRGPELARVRAGEALCAANALGIRTPILLGFPDAKLGDYVDDPSRVYRLTDRVLEQLQRLRPDALISWGPDGATGHPDHRVVGTVVTQLVRSGAAGVPERLFYASIRAEGMRAMNPGRGEPPHLIPQAKYFTVRVPFSETDFDAARRAMACHRTQYSDETVQRTFEMAKGGWNGMISLSPLFPADAGSDLFR